MRKVNYKEKGITLIALVITIIILLILAGVTLTTALSQNGLFQRAKYAGEKYKESEVDEAEKLGEVEKEIDKITEGKDSTPSDPKEEIGIDLYSTVEIGDYVYMDSGTDYNSEYVNNCDFSEFYTTTTEPLTGWRVLSKDENSKTIKLISAGCPLTYFFPKTIPGLSRTSTALNDFDNLYKSITKVESGIGFRGNGFGLDDLRKVFNNGFIDIDKGVHTFSCLTHYNENTGSEKKPINEVEELYEAITGETQTMTQLKGKNLQTSMLKKLVEEKEKSWNTKWNDMLCIGQKYWIGGISYDYLSIWDILDTGYPGGVVEDATMGIRPVVTLKSTVKIAGNNAGDGSSSNSAYILTIETVDARQN